MILELPDDCINELQRAALAKLFETLKWSHHADITVRKDGQDYGFQADWLKHLKLLPLPPGGQQQGWRLVPVEPTEAMLAAANADESTPHVDGMIGLAAAQGVTLPLEFTGDNLPLIRWWRAMVKAAPSPEPEGRTK